VTQQTNNKEAPSTQEVGECIEAATTRYTRFKRNSRSFIGYFESNCARIDQSGTNGLSVVKLWRTHGFARQSTIDLQTNRQPAPIVMKLNDKGGSSLV